MMARKTFSYKDAGVDIRANDAMVERIRSAVRRTYSPRVIGGHGQFAGLFRLDYAERLLRRNYSRPVLVGCADGVGTKVLLAIKCNKLDTIGIDLVAMNVNDLITTGAEPLFFLDYIAVNKLIPDMVARIVDGISAGCTLADCALMGGETAEMPDLYAKNDFDLAGFAVGVAEERRIINPQRVSPGDIVIGLASSGLHSNGYSLVRKVLGNVGRKSLSKRVEGLERPLGEELLCPTRIYVRSILSLLKRYKRKRVVSAMAHITGGGLPGNLARVLPDGQHISIRSESWPVPPIFKFLRRKGIRQQEMLNVFNMGIGFVLIVRPAFARSIMAQLKQSGQTPYEIGEVGKGAGGVRIDGK